MKKNLKLQKLVNELDAKGIKAGYWKRTLSRHGGIKCRVVVDMRLTGETLKNIGVTLNLSSARIRQIESKAIKILSGVLTGKVKYVLLDFNDISVRLSLTFLKEAKFPPIFQELVDYVELSKLREYDAIVISNMLYDCFGGCRYRSFGRRIVIFPLSVLLDLFLDFILDGYRRKKYIEDFLHTKQWNKKRKVEKLNALIYSSPRIRRWDCKGNKSFYLFS